MSPMILKAIMVSWVLLSSLPVIEVEGQLISQFGETEWQLEMVAKSWWDAKSSCEANFSSLVSLGNAEKVGELLQFMGSNGVKSMWVGATYINSKLEWLDGLQTDVVELKDQSITGVEGNCMVFTPGQTMPESGVMRRNCAVKYPFLCERNACPESDSSFRGRCYRMLQSPGDFQDVREKCFQLGEDYILASVATKDIIDFVTSFGQGKRIFISPYYSMSKLVTSDQMPLNSMYFDGPSYSPMKDCVVLNTTSALWELESCYPMQEAIILCEYRTKDFYQRFVQNHRADN